MTHIRPLHDAIGLPLTLSRHYWRGCSGKRRFTSKKHARAEARRLTTAGRVSTTLVTYKCSSCRGWHNGNR